MCFCDVLFTIQAGDIMSNELGALLEKVRTKKNLSLREAASLTGLGHSYIRDLELGINRKTGKKVIPSIHSLQKLAKAYNLNIYELLHKAGFIDIEDFQKNDRIANKELPNAIPLYESITSITKKVKEMTEHVYYPFTQNNNQPDFALTMDGNAMSGAGIHDGDLVFFQKLNHPEYNGQIVVAYIPSEKIGYIRRIEWSAQFPQYSLVSPNSNYQTIHVPFHDVNIYGVYRGHFKPEKSK